ncbi:CUE domain-containing protein 1 [Striga asiatica]|uniref:CUE domain-containing protein 1 n=1 Tax=Striga asiatica TaxID=4170 RepID=A0A5A7PAB7_STRAF|nr:CUE domain-containing protein 1 [Striga asiatica]
MAIPRVALSKKHIPPQRGRALVPQPLDGLRHAALALAPTQIPRALRHTPHLPRHPHPEILPPRRQVRQHAVLPREHVPAGGHGRPTSVGRHRPILLPHEGRVVVPHEAAVELQGGAGGPGAGGGEAGDGGGNAPPAVGAGEVSAALTASPGPEPGTEILKLLKGAVEAELTREVRMESRLDSKGEVGPGEYLSWEHPA